jgi:hypothetical protein
MLNHVTRATGSPLLSSLPTLSVPFISLFVSLPLFSSLFSLFSLFPLFVSHLVRSEGDDVERERREGGIGEVRGARGKANGAPPRDGGVVFQRLLQRTSVLLKGFYIKP